MSSSDYGTLSMRKNKVLGRTLTRWRTWLEYVNNTRVFMYIIFYIENDIPVLFCEKLLLTIANHIESRYANKNHISLPSMQMDSLWFRSNDFSAGWWWLCMTHRHWMHLPSISMSFVLVVHRRMKYERIGSHISAIVASTKNIKICEYSSRNIYR